MKTTHRSYDAVVVGARVAGAATAMLLARMGLRVLALDRSREGSDTLSTHALMRAGVQQLYRWGVLDRIRQAGTPPVRTTTFHYGDDAVEIAIKARDGVDALYAPRRTVLDALLVRAAREAGAEVEHDRHVIDLTRDDAGRVNGVVMESARGDATRVRAGIVIGADGIRSRVAHLAGAGLERSARHASATIYGYVPAPEGDGYHWYYRPGVSVGTIPTNDGQMGLFVSMSPEHFRAGLPLGLENLHRRVLAQAAPELADRLTGVKLIGKPFPFAGERGFLRRPWGPGWALVGDAGYFKDPITAHGITDALLDAEHLARAVAAGGDLALEHYQKARNARAEEFLQLTDTIASFGWTLDELKQQHLRLSQLMVGEMAVLKTFESEESWVATPG
jgi:2-polyprenyl-6-methoxyphenol hydroxylase-like FAD-dependent oxidoreductase